LKTKITICNDAYQLSVLVNNRYSANTVLAHDLLSIPDRGVHMKDYRIEDHPALGALHLTNLLGLQLDLHVLVNESQSSLQGHTYSQVCLGDGIHGSGYNWNIELDIRGQKPFCGRFPGKYFRISGNEKHIVIRKCFEEKF
jgi:hypothetical protein